MNVFVLNSGRCGSTTFIQACSHITNYTSAHESRAGLVGRARFEYPQNHIEADNRLSWFLGRLERAYGDDAMYVHLRRGEEATAKSFVKRYEFGIVNAYRKHILMGCPDDVDPMAIAGDYCDTVNSNIELFLRGKSRWMAFSLESAKQDFRRFWNLIEAKGDLEGALSEFDVRYNSSRQTERRNPKFLTNTVLNMFRRARRLAPLHQD